MRQSCVCHTWCGHRRREHLGRQQKSLRAESVSYATATRSWNIFLPNSPLPTNEQLSLLTHTIFIGLVVMICTTPPPISHDPYGFVYLTVSHSRLSKYNLLPSAGDLGSIRKHSHSPAHVQRKVLILTNVTARWRDLQSLRFLLLYIMMSSHAHIIPDISGRYLGRYNIYGI